MGEGALLTYQKGKRRSRGERKTKKEITRPNEGGVGGLLQKRESQRPWKEFS